jgi:hypothetical protein
MSKSKDNSDTFMRRFRKRQAKRVRALCLSVGLATAWGGTQQADADITFDVSIESQVTLSKAYVSFGNNISTPVVIPLGRIEAGVPFHSQITLTDNPYQWQADPSIYELITPSPYYDYHDPRWTILALYGNDSVDGVAMAFRDSLPISDGTTFEDVFTLEWDSFSEEEIIDLLESGDGDKIDSILYFVTDVRGNRAPLRYISIPLYGETGVLTTFSTAGFGGNATVSIVPELGSLLYCLIFASLGISIFLMHRPRSIDAKCLPHCEE